LDAFKQLDFRRRRAMRAFAHPAALGKLLSEWKGDPLVPKTLKAAFLHPAFDPNNHLSG
jgi:hypothetical protein